MPHQIFSGGRSTRHAVNASSRASKQRYCHIGRAIDIYCRCVIKIPLLIPLLTRVRSARLKRNVCGLWYIQRNRWLDLGVQTNLFQLIASARGRRSNIDLQRALDRRVTPQHKELVGRWSAATLPHFRGRGDAAISSDAPNPAVRHRTRRFFVLGELPDFACCAHRTACRYTVFHFGVRRLLKAKTAHIV
jgi:hypothetical protein